VTINEDTYEQIKDATFKNPKELKDCPTEIQESVNKWILLRGNTDIVDQTKPIQVSSISLGVYSSSDFVKKIDDVYHIITGDFAFGVPYLRSLQIGFQIATEAALAANTLFENAEPEKAEYAFNLETAVEDDKLTQSFELESLPRGVTIPKR